MSKVVKKDGEIQERKMGRIILQDVSKGCTSLVPLTPGGHREQSPRSSLAPGTAIFLIVSRGHPKATERLEMGLFPPGAEPRGSSACARSRAELAGS